MIWEGYFLPLINLIDGDVVGMVGETDVGGCNYFGFGGEFVRLSQVAPLVS